jgi:hypothetical protein
MSSVLYYSNFCEPSKKLLQTISKTQSGKDMHFICIDNRVKDQNGKIYIQLQNGQRIIMPENVTRVPALMLLNQNYRVVYGEEIYKHIKPNIQQQMKQATNNNMVPQAAQDGFDCFGGFGGGAVASDNFSFLDQDDNELGVRGDGGLRQMHNYVSINDNGHFSFEVPKDNQAKGASKLKEGEMSIEALQRQRDQELAGLGFSRQQPSQQFDNASFNQNFDQQFRR